MYKVPKEIISLSIVLCLFIHNIGSNHDRETKLTFFNVTHITSITSARDEFL